METDSISEVGRQILLLGLEKGLGELGKWARTRAREFWALVRVSEFWALVRAREFWVLNRTREFWAQARTREF